MEQRGKTTMVLQQKPERQLVEEAFAAGRLYVEDEHGFHHGMYAVCPNDGGHAQPSRPIWQRDARGRYIAHVLFHCHNGGRTWEGQRCEIHLY